MNIVRKLIIILKLMHQKIRSIKCGELLKNTIKLCLNIRNKSAERNEIVVDEIGPNYKVYIISIKL